MLKFTFLLFKGGKSPSVFSSNKEQQLALEAMTRLKTNPFLLLNGERSHAQSALSLYRNSEWLNSEISEDADDDVLQLPEAVFGDGARARQAAVRPGRGRVRLRPRVLPRGHPH